MVNVLLYFQIKKNKLAIKVKFKFATDIQNTFEANLMQTMDHINAQLS
jgi:hypothetical protein